MSNILHSEILPLRKSSVLGARFAEDKPLPHRIGDLTRAAFPLIRITADRFFAADHVMETTAVQTGGVATDGWDQVIESDEAGHSWTVVRLSAPVDDGVAVTACGRGKRDPVTGALYENPADVFRYLYRISGRDVSRAQLRAECSAAGLRLAGSIDAFQPLKDHLNAWAACAGAIWSPWSGRLYPVTTAEPPVIELSRMRATNLQVRAQLAGACDVLRIAYDREDATGRPLKAMTLSARPQKLGGLVREVDLPFLRLAANCEDVGRRDLARRAGETYTVTFNSDRGDLRPGRWVRLVSHPEWPFAGDPDPDVMILAVELTPDSNAVAVIGEHVRAYPEVEVIAHSIALPGTKAPSLDVAYRDGVLRLSVRDENGLAIKGARVSLDGGLARATDESGSVSFVTTRGGHKVAISAPNMADQEIDITA